MNRIFALYDSDSVYAARFVDYFKHKKEYQFEFIVFTQEESLKEYLSAQDLEILLLGEPELTQDLSLERVKHVYLLTDAEDQQESENQLISQGESAYGRQQASENQIVSEGQQAYGRWQASEGRLISEEPQASESRLISGAQRVSGNRRRTFDNYRLIYKYQAATAIMNEIMEDYNGSGRVAIATGYQDAVRIISVFSPMNSAEAIAYAWSFGSILGEQQKVLLILLNPLPVTLILQADDNNTFLTEYIYYLKEQHNNTVQRKLLPGSLGNLSYLTGITHAADIMSLTNEDIYRWAEELRNNNSYHTVIFYLGAFTEAISELMNISDQVYVTGNGSGYEEAVLSTWAQQMERSGIQVNRDKFIKQPLEKEDSLDGKAISLAELRKTAAWDIARRSIQGSRE